VGCGLEVCVGVFVGFGDFASLLDVGLGDSIAFAVEVGVVTGFFGFAAPDVSLLLKTSVL
jgi:hypothetical protein